MKWSLTINGDESEVKNVLEKLVKVVSDHTKPAIEMPSESKYSPLRQYLSKQKDAGKTTLDLSLGDVQEIIGSELPNSAYEYDAFWRDRSRNVGVCIVQSGWQINALERDSNNRITKVKLQTSSGRLKKAEKTAIAHTLQQVGGNKRKAAELLGISRRELYRKLHEFDFDRSGSTENACHPASPEDAKLR